VLRSKVSLIAGGQAPGLRHQHSQKPGFGIPGRGDSFGHAALHAAGAEPALHRRDAREAVGGDRRAAEGLGHDGQDAKVAEAADEFGKTIKFATLTLSKNLNFAIL